MAAKKAKSALEEVKGVDSPEPINKIDLKRIKYPTTPEFIKKIREGDIGYLSRAITLIESKHPKHRAQAAEIINSCLPFANKSIRIGITGVPGVGKSTFIEAFGYTATQLGKKVAVLAIDPSSSIQKGSILGDKTRMEKLVNNPLAYIRPSPAGETLGGVARKTRETITLCEAAGYDTIIIETVGVGQSETSVHSMVDFFLLLKLVGAGDELQGIKRGIIEMADAIIINKADGEFIKMAILAQAEFKRALHLYPIKPSKWQPIVETCSALEETGIDPIWNIIEDYFKRTKSNGYFDIKRKEQNLFWMHETINGSLKNRFYQNSVVKKEMIRLEKKVQNNKISPFQAAQELLKIDLINKA